LNGPDRIKNVTFILAKGWAASPFQSSYEKAKARGWKICVLPCGPEVMLDMAEELTEELLAASKNRNAETGIPGD
jgi:hypothetical protein